MRPRKSGRARTRAGAGGRISPRDVGRRDPLLGTSKARADWYPDVVRLVAPSKGETSGVLAALRRSCSRGRRKLPSRGVQKVGDPPDPS